MMESWEEEEDGKMMARRERQKRRWEELHPDFWKDEEQGWEKWFEGNQHDSPPPFPPLGETRP